MGRRGPAPKPEVALRRTKALKLRAAGASYDDIARTLGLPTAKHAATDVSRAMRLVPREAGIEALAIEQERLDRLQVLAWRLAEKGDVRGIREVCRVLERRARLLGLDYRDRADRADDDGLEAATSLLDRIDAGLKAQYAAGELDEPITDDTDPDAA
jgi:hypothetical protein